MFDTNEKIEILKKIGYEIERDTASIKSRKSKFSKIEPKYYVIKDGEKLEIDVVFKEEVYKRIFSDLL